MNRRALAALVFAWWFAVTDDARVLGPFVNREMCEAIRAQMRVRATACWWDGKA